MEWLLRARRGRGVVGLVTGDPGIGKTALVARMRTLARGRGTVVENFTALASEPSVPPLQCMVVVADGVDARDAAARDRIRSLARRVGVHAMLFVVALDTGDDLVDALLADGAQQIALGALPDGDVARLLGARTDRLDTIVSLACGNPRHARELANANPPRSLADALAALERSHGGRAVRLLATLAVATDDHLGIDAVLARTLLGRRSDVDDALRWARGARFVARDRFVDALTRDVVEAALGEAARTHLHARAARILAHRPPHDAAPPVAGRLVRHYGRGGSPERACAVALERADQAVRDARFAAARDGYAAAIAFATLDDAASGRAHVALARCLEFVGESEGSLRALRVAVETFERGGDRTAAIEAELNRARLAFASGDADVHRVALAHVTDLARDVDGIAHVPTLLHFWGFALAMHRETDAVGALEALATREREMPPTVHVRFLALRAMHAAIFATSGAPAFDDDARAAIAEAESAGLWRDAGYVYANQGCSALVAGRTDRAKRAMGSAVELAVRTGSTDLLLHELVDLASVAVLEGECERAVTLLQRPEFERAPVLLLAKRAWPAARLATLLPREDLIDLESARRLFEASRRMGSVEDVLWAGGALALLLARRGDAEASDVADLAVEGLLHVFSTFDAVALIAPLGSARTIERGRSLLANLRRSHDPRIVTAMHDLFELQTLRRARRHDSARAKRLGRSAARALEALGWTMLRRQALLWGGFESEADALAEQLHLPVASTAPNLLVLTPRETAIARRICAGARNADLAAELRISESTVEKHVTSILEKFGLRSRHEIRHALEPTGASTN